MSALLNIFWALLLVLAAAVEGTSVPKPVVNDPKIAAIAVEAPVCVEVELIARVEVVGEFERDGKMLPETDYISSDWLKLQEGDRFMVDTSVSSGLVQSFWITSTAPFEIRNTHTSFGGSTLWRSDLLTLQNGTSFESRFVTHNDILGGLEVVSAAEPIYIRVSPQGANPYREVELPAQIKICPPIKEGA